MDSKVTPSYPIPNIVACWSAAASRLRCGCLTRQDHGCLQEPRRPTTDSRFSRQAATVEPVGNMTSSVSHWPKGRFSRTQIVPPYNVPRWLETAGTHDMAVAQTLRQQSGGQILIPSWIPRAAVPQVPHQAFHVGPAHLATLRHHPFSFDFPHVSYTNLTFRSVVAPCDNPYFGFPRPSQGSLSVPKISQCVAITGRTA
jgi:hypothetical protein